MDANQISALRASPFDLFSCNKSRQANFRDGAKILDRAFAVLEPVAFVQIL
jgi:hypothetical protein